MSKTVPVLRAHGLLMALMLLIVPAYLAWSWSDQLGYLGGDAAFYLIMAQAWSPFAPHDALFASVAAASRFPPLYPLLLALSGGARDLVVAHLVTTLTLLIALVGLYAWLVRSGASRAQAAVVVLITAMLPQTLMLALWPQSEYPYLALSLGCLAALACYREQPTLKFAAMAALAAAAACMTRTIGIALLPAVALVFVLGPRRKDLLLVAAAALPLALWMFLHRSSSDSYVNILQVSYSAQGLQRLVQQLSAQPSLFRYGFAGNFLQTTGLMPAVDAIGLAIVGAWLSRLVRLRADAVYALGYAAIVAIWPYPEEIARLLWPLVPVALGGLVVEAAALGRRVSPLSRDLAGAAVVGAAFFITLPMDAYIVDRWTLTGDDARTLRRLPDWYEIDPRRAFDVARSEQAMAELFQQLPDDVVESDCVVSVKPQLVEYFAHRRSVQPPLDAIPDPQFGERLRASGCSYVLMVGWKDRIYPTPLHPMQRIRPDIDIVKWAILESPFSGDLYMAGALGRFKERQ